MIRGVLFDYGGVVARGGRGVDLARRLAEELGLTAEQATETVLPLLQLNTRGKLNTEAFWDTLAGRIGHAISESQRHLWDNWWNTEFFPEMANVILALKNHNYQVGLLSNIVPSAAQIIRAAGCYDVFDFTILSCEIGYAKPDSEIYDLAMNSFKDLRPEEVVFVDDQPKCLPPAEAIGMATILATDPAQVIAELKKFNLPV